MSFGPSFARNGRALNSRNVSQAVDAPRGPVGVP